MIALEAIRADIKNQLFVGRILNSKDFNDGLKWCLELIDKYAGQEQTTRQSCENCKQNPKECGNDAHYGFCQNWEKAEQEPCDFSFEIDYKTDVGRFVFSDGTEKRVNMGAVMNFSALKLAKKAYECGKAEALSQEPTEDDYQTDMDEAWKQAKREPCDDAVSRQAGKNGE